MLQNMDIPSAFSEEEQKKATAAAEFLRMNAEDALRDFEESSGATDEDRTFKTSFITLIDTYCADPELAEGQVSRFLSMLPKSGNRIANAFVAHAILLTTRNALREKVGIEIDMVEEAERGKEQGRDVRDASIRESAGYTNDGDVAESALTDAAQEQNITDNDIGESAAEDVSYVDRVKYISPAMTFLRQTRRLAEGICNHCAADAALLQRAALTPQEENPSILQRHIQRLMAQVEPVRDEDK
jgi:hypothetical protein